MQRRGGERGPYKKHGDGWCVWCGDPFATNHNNARTCSPRCRSRLAAFRARTGFDPEEPVGKVTADQAYKTLIGLLLIEERNRRAALAALKEGGASKMFEVVKQQQAAKPKKPKSA